MRKIIVVVGAGDLGKAVCLLLAQFASFDASYFLADKALHVAQQNAQWIASGLSDAKRIEPLLLDVTKTDHASVEVLRTAELIIDCLPGWLCKHTAQLARENDLHYVSMTALPEEIPAIQEIAFGAGTAFLLQAGVSPGLVSLLLKDLYMHYRSGSVWPKVDYAGVRVALVPPRISLKGTSQGQQAFLSCREAILVSNVRQAKQSPDTIWEANEFNGCYLDATMMTRGEGNFVNVLAGRARQTGHPMQLRQCKQTQAYTNAGVNRDWVLVQAVVEGYTASDRAITLLQSCQIHPIAIGRIYLNAIQSANAVLLAECVHLLLRNPTRGLIFMNQLEPELILNGRFVQQYFIVSTRPEVVYYRSQTGDPSDQ